MSNEYIEFGGKKSTDFYLVIQKDGVQISQPEENRIEATLPFMNGFYDFSKWQEKGRTSSVISR